MVRDKLDSRKDVFVDWSLVEPGYAVSWSDALSSEWETPRGIQLKVEQPRIQAEPMIEIEKPWETSYVFMTTIFEDEGRYRLYYTSWNHLPGDAQMDLNPYSRFLCYAESDDGDDCTIINSESSQYQLKVSINFLSHLC